MFDVSPRWASLLTASIVRTYVSIPDVTHESLLLNYYDYVFRGYYLIPESRPVKVANGNTLQQNQANG
jgi:hypothetical protein